MYKLPLTGILLVLVLLSGCGSGGSDSPNSANGKLYLARNVVFKPNLTSSAHAQSYAIDTETQVLAENVVFEGMANSNIESENVQDALEEISLLLNEVMVGQWSIQNYNFEIMHESTGSVTIAGDGTFDLTEGSFAAIGMGSGTAQVSTCKHSQENQTYESYSEELIAFIHYNPHSNPPTRNSAIPRLVKLRENEIIFIGNGGCGEMGRERVSILTRIVE